MTKQQVYKSFLPSHSCSCGKEFTLPGSLTNHVKKFQSNISKNIHKKIDRGVPEGRTRKIPRYQINRLLRIFKRQAKNQGSNQNENAEEQISDQEGVKIFSQMKEFIDRLIEDEDKDAKLELQKENIRFQQMWLYLHKDEIQRCTQVYIRSVFYHLMQERKIKVNKNVIEDHAQSQILSNIEWQIMQMLNDCRKEEKLLMKVKQECNGMWQEDKEEEIEEKEYQTENNALENEQDSTDSSSSNEVKTLKVKQEEKEYSAEDKSGDLKNNLEMNTGDNELEEKKDSKLNNENVMNYQKNTPFLIKEEHDDFIFQMQQSQQIQAH